MMNDRIVLLQSMVQELEAKDSATVANYTGQIAALNEQKKLFEDQIKTYEKLLKKERFKRKLTAASGVVTTGLAVFLALKK